MQGCRSRVAAIAMAALAAGSMLAFLGGPHVAAEAADPLRATTYGNTVLAASTALYAVERWQRVPIVGRAASLLAATGAGAVLLALAGSAALGATPFPTWHEAMAMVASLAVFAYLLLERAYVDRSAGFPVMLVVMGTVAGEMWLISRGLSTGGGPTPRLAAYWGAAYQLAACIAFAPLALAASVRLAAGCRWSGPRAATASRSLIAVGWPVLAMATGMAVAWAVAEPAAVEQALAGAALGFAGLALSAIVGAAA